MKIIGFSYFCSYHNGSLTDSYWTFVFKYGKKKKVPIRFTTSDVIDSLGLPADSSPELIQNEISSLYGREILFHRFSPLSF